MRRPALPERAPALGKWNCFVSSSAPSFRVLGLLYRTFLLECLRRLLLFLLLLIHAFAHGHLLLAVLRSTLLRHTGYPSRPARNTTANAAVITSTSAVGLSTTHSRRGQVTILNYNPVRSDGISQRRGKLTVNEVPQSRLESTLILPR